MSNRKTHVCNVRNSTEHSIWSITNKSILSRPHRKTLEILKRVFRYIRGTSEVSILYGAEQSPLLGYTDSDHVRDITRHSVNGEIFLLNGGAVTWSSKKQRTVALSTTEAEYVALG